MWLVREAADGLRPMRRAAGWCAESRRAVCGLWGMSQMPSRWPSTVESWASQAVRGLIMRYGRYWRGVRNVRERANRADHMRVAEEDGDAELWPRAGWRAGAVLEGIIIML